MSGVDLQDEFQLPRDVSSSSLSLIQLRRRINFNWENPGNFQSFFHALPKRIFWSEKFLSIKIGIDPVTHKKISPWKLISNIFCIFFEKFLTSQNENHKRHDRKFCHKKKIKQKWERNATAWGSLLCWRVEWKWKLQQNWQRWVHLLCNFEVQRKFLLN